MSRSGLLLLSLILMASAPAARADSNPPDVVGGVVSEMESRLAPLDGACDFNAPFAYTYLVTTREVRQALQDGLFSDDDAMERLDSTFAGLYFDAYDRYRAGQPGQVPAPWLAAFRSADARKLTVLQDVLLGMNAHINYDLAIAVYQTGYDLGGANLKADYDRINSVLDATAPVLMDDLSRYFDPSFRLAELGGKRFEDLYVDWVIVGWRAQAWENALKLRAAATPEEFENVRSAMESHAESMAERFSIPLVPLERGGRELYCRIRSARPE